MELSYENIYLEESKSLKIETYQYASLCPFINWHIHPEYEIVFVRNGSGNIQIDTYSENYNDGLLILLGPNVPHMPFGNKQYKNNVEVVIQFTEEFIREKLERFPEFKSIVHCIKTADHGILFSRETHKKLTSSFLKFKSQNNIEKLINCTQILYQLSISKAQKKLTKPKFGSELSKHSLKRISKVYEYINKHYDKEIKSKIVAKELGLTPNSFCRLFRAATNRKFIDFLNEFRIKKAQELLGNNHISISEIMYQCGYNDASYFAKQFKKYTMITPSEYRSGLRA